MHPLQMKVRVKITNSTHPLQTQRNRDGARKQTLTILRHCPTRVKVDQTQKQTPLRALLMRSPCLVTSQVDSAALHIASLQIEKQAGDAPMAQQVDFLKGSIWLVLKGSRQRKT